MSMAAATANGLILAAASDDKFQARLSALTKSTEDAKKAFNDLRIGKDAKKAYEKAAAKEADADAKLEAAEKQAREIVAAASAQAGDAIRAAEVMARDIIAKAKADAEEMRSTALSLEADAAELKQSLDAELKAARTAAAAAKRERAEAEKKAEEAKGECAAHKAQLDRLLDVEKRLKAILGEI